MRIGVVIPGAIVALLLGGCQGRSKFVRIDSADIFRVKGEYTLIALRADFMAKMFGPTWERQRIFYGSNRAITNEGPAIINSRSPLRPLTPGNAILVISGNDWPDLLVPMYSMDTRVFVLLKVDLQRPRIALSSPPSASTRRAFLTPDGHLPFE